MINNSKKNILFYYPSNKRSIAMETLLITLNNTADYNVMVLTTCQKGDLHTILENNNIQIFTYTVKNNISIIYYLKQIFYLIKFSKKNKIEYIHSHLQHCNIIAVLAQYFIKAKVIIFRHHFQYIKNSSYKFPKNKNEVLFDKVINRLAKVIVVPSSGVKKGMIMEEGVNPDKIKIIPYIYDFDKYPKPDLVEAEKIKQKYPAKLRLIMVSRLVKLKQHHIVFPVIKELIDEGLDINLLVLDEGPEVQNLKNWIIENKMENHIFMLGFRKDFINYMAAADVLLQPSLTDASNSVAKEMGLLEKIVVVTEGVGDYSDYIVDGENGFLIPKFNLEETIKEIIKSIYYKPNDYCLLGKRLKEQVIQRFSKEKSGNVIKKYIDILEK